MEKVLRDKKALIVFILPGLIAYLWFTFYPICLSIYYSFFSGVPGLDFKFVGLENYKKLLSDSIFRESASVTLIYLLVSATGMLVMGYATALFLAFALKKYTDEIRTLIYMPVVIPAVGAAALFTKVFEIQPYYGLLNSFLAAIGLGSMVKSWLGSSDTALMSLCIADIWRMIGYYMVIFYAGIISFPKELEEAARIDGATTMQTIRKILMPYMRPVTIMAVILCLNNTFRVYDMPVVLTAGGPGRSTFMLSMYTYQKAFYDWQYGYSSMLAVIMMVFILILTQSINYVNEKMTGLKE